LYHLRRFTQAERRKHEVSCVQKRKTALKVKDATCGAGLLCVGWGCPAEHRGSLDFLAPPFALRQKVENMP
jgi:hypothetical protein